MLMNGRELEDEGYGGTMPIAKAENKKQVGGNHYSMMAITPTNYILANKIGWLEGNAIKYISRYQNKNGVEDLKKALHYVELIIERETKNGNG